MPLRITNINVEMRYAGFSGKGRFISALNKIIKKYSGSKYDISDYNSDDEYPGERRSSGKSLCLITNPSGDVRFVKELSVLSELLKPDEFEVYSWILLGELQMNEEFLDKLIDFFLNVKGIIKLQDNIIHIDLFDEPLGLTVKLASDARKSILKKTTLAQLSKLGLWVESNHICRLNKEYWGEWMFMLGANNFEKSAEMFKTLEDCLGPEYSKIQSKTIGKPLQKFRENQQRNYKK